MNSRLSFRFIVTGLILLLIIQISCDRSSKKGFLVEGTLFGLDSTWIYLQKPVENGWESLDSQMVVDGNFVFRGNVEKEDLYHLRIGNTTRTIMVFIDNQPIVVEGQVDSLEKVRVEGTKVQETYNKYLIRQRGLRKQQERLLAQWIEANESGNQDTLEDVNQEFALLEQETDQFLLAAVTSNLDNPLGPYFATMLYFNDDEIDALDSLVKKFDRGLEGTYHYDNLTDVLERWKMLSIGSKAFSFAQEDPIGNSLALDSIDGAYILIDFWASWCDQCREGNAELKEIYEQYHDSGFEIVAVSLDTDHRAWTNAIKEDRLKWLHVSDLQGWGNEVGVLYGVRAIPYTVLVDQSGTIIAKNIRGAGLERKLEELFVAL